jgi:hypothetical protein
MIHPVTHDVLGEVTDIATAANYGDMIRIDATAKSGSVDLSLELRLGNKTQYELNAPKMYGLLVTKILTEPMALPWKATVKFVDNDTNNFTPATQGSYSLELIVDDSISSLQDGDTIVCLRPTMAPNSSLHFI